MVTFPYGVGTDFSGAIPYGVVVGLSATLIVVGIFLAIKSQWLLSAVAVVGGIVLGYFRDPATVLIQPAFPVLAWTNQDQIIFFVAVGTFFFASLGLFSLLVVITGLQKSTIYRFFFLFVAISFLAVALEIIFIYIGFAPNIGKAGSPFPY